MFRTFLVAAALAATATLANAEIRVSDAYIRSATPVSPTGAAFMVIENTGAAPMRLTGAASEAAARVELHSHSEDASGMMVMGEIEGGIEIAPGASHRLARGGDHVMFMGLADALEEGASVPLTLIFEDGSEVALEVPVDRERQDAHGGHGEMDHGSGDGAMGHGEMDHGGMDHGAAKDDSAKE
ncbi:copper chaperone PCu(A)C [Roseivivax sp. GX 12232]|uniref:copper chaperone PCu(A)C n=1 Tax=Roseivivax sp. GX 12232 TaxID=2900547 RepID=UPI001E5DDC91|nr:copper chaperone PCu(A)C [Roseivivax sp. GX 12232]MCE0505121.1 copper chaperone PCu(A)C [Roseivivax sp. GX 12232]